jgi:hypothetical protein
MVAIKTFEVKASEILYLHCVAVSTIRVTQDGRMHCCCLMFKRNAEANIQTVLTFYYMKMFKWAEYFKISFLRK